MCRRKNSCCPEMYVSAYPRGETPGGYDHLSTIPIPAGVAKVVTRSDWLGSRNETAYWSMEWISGGYTETHRAINPCTVIISDRDEAYESCWSFGVSPAYLAWLHIHAKRLEATKRFDAAWEFYHVHLCPVASWANGGLSRPVGTVPGTAMRDILDLFSKSFGLKSTDEAVSTVFNTISPYGEKRIAASLELEFYQDWD